MASNFDVTQALFAQIDTNKDGGIDENEFRSWLSKSGPVTSSPYESSANGTAAVQIDTNETNVSVQNATESTTGIAASYGVTTASEGSTVGGVVTTNSVQQTNQYIAQAGNTIYNDPNPQIVRRPAAGGLLTYQQRILVRFLQPPAVPPPGPLIIKEVRPPQPPPPPPLVIRQCAKPLPAPPPFILRERPPQPPPIIASQTVIRRLPAIPVPPRSLIIERLPPAPQKPRDIIIERWVPYGPPAKRRTIVQHAPAPVKYPAPRNIIVVYDPVQARVVRQFQRLGVVQENPQNYVTRYGTSLLDSGTLVQQARNAGVIEDISPPAPTSSAQTNTLYSFNAGTSGNATSFNDANATTGQGLSSSSGITSFEGTVPVIGTAIDTINQGSPSYSSTAFVNGSALADSAGGIVDTAVATTTTTTATADTNRDGQ